MGERRQLRRLAAVWLLLLAALACHARPQDAATTKLEADNVITGGALPTTTAAAPRDSQQEKEVARDVSNRYSRLPAGLPAPAPTDTTQPELSSQHARRYRSGNPSLWRANFLQLADAVKSVSKIRRKSAGEPFSGKNVPIETDSPHDIILSNVPPHNGTGNLSHPCNQGLHHKTSSGCDTEDLVVNTSGHADGQKQVVLNFSYPLENVSRNPLLRIDTLHTKIIGDSRAKLRRISNSEPTENEWRKIVEKTLDNHVYVRIDNVPIERSAVRPSRTHGVDNAKLLSHVMLSFPLNDRPRPSDNVSGWSGNETATPHTSPDRQLERIEPECFRCEGSKYRNDVSTISKSFGKFGQLVSYTGRLVNKSQPTYNTNPLFEIRYQLHNGSTENSEEHVSEEKSTKYGPLGSFSKGDGSFSENDGESFRYFEKMGYAGHNFWKNYSSVVLRKVSTNNESIHTWNNSELALEETTLQKFKPAGIDAIRLAKADSQSTLMSNTQGKLQLRGSITTGNERESEGIYRRLSYINYTAEVSPRLLQDGNHMMSEKTIEDDSTEVIIQLRTKDDAVESVNTHGGLIQTNDGGDISLPELLSGRNHMKVGKKINDGSIELVTNFIANSLPDLKTPAASALTRPGPKPLPTDLYVPVSTTSKTGDGGLKTWPGGGSGIESLDDLIMYHTYTDNHPYSDHHQSHPQNQGPVLIQQHHDGGITGVIKKPVTLGSSGWTNSPAHWDDYSHHHYTTTAHYPLYHQSTEPPMKKPVIIIVEEPSTNGYLPLPPSTTPKYDYTVHLHQPVATHPPHYSPSNTPPPQSTNGCPSIVISASGSVNNANSQKESCGEVSIVINSDITNTNSISSQSSPEVVQPTGRPPLGDDDYESPGSDEDDEDEEGEEEEEEEEAEETTSKPSKPQKPIKPVRPHKPHRPHKPSQTAVSSGSGGYLETLLTSTSALNPLSLNFWKVIFAPLAMLVVGGFGLMFLMFPWMFAGLVWRRTFGWRRESLRREDDTGRLGESLSRVITTPAPFPWRCDGRRCNYNGKLWDYSKGSRRKKRSSWSYSPYRGWLMGT